MKKLEEDKELSSLLDKAYTLSPSKRDFVEEVKQQNSILEVIPAAVKEYEDWWTACFLKLCRDVKVHRVRFYTSVGHYILMVSDRESFVKFLQSHVNRANSKVMSLGSVQKMLTTRVARAVAIEKEFIEDVTCALNTDELRVREIKRVIEIGSAEPPLSREAEESLNYRLKFLEKTQSEVDQSKGILERRKKLDLGNMTKEKLQEWLTRCMADFKGRKMNSKVVRQNDGTPVLFTELESFLSRDIIDDEVVKNACSALLLKEITEL